MKPDPQLVRLPASRTVSTHAFAFPPALPAGLRSRTALPVVSNRAFIAAWTARRAALVAAAHAGRRN